MSIRSSLLKQQVAKRMLVLPPVCVKVALIRNHEPAPLLAEKSSALL